MSFRFSQCIQVLQVKKTAVKITDDELKSIELKEKETARMELEKGSQTIKLISALSSFQIKRKVGANKQLFGILIMILRNCIPFSYYYLIS